MPPFPWTLDKKEWTTTIFNKKKMREFTDIGLIYGFIKAEMGVSFVGLKRYEALPTEIKTELDMVRQFKQLYNKKQKHFAVGHKLPKHMWGRTIPMNYRSLSVFHRPTRHRLCQGIYRDLDIQNAHAQFIYDINCQHGNELFALRKYVDDPKGWRKNICDHHGLDFDNPEQRDIAKQLPIRLLFGGSYGEWIKDFNIEITEQMPTFVGIEREMALVMSTVYATNPQIVKDVLRHDPQKWKKEGEMKRGVMALWAQTIERRLMEDAVQYLVTAKKFVLEDIVPCQDGLMILENLWYDGILEDLKQQSRDKYGFHLTWADKEFDEAIEIPTHNDTKSALEWSEELSGKRLGVRLLQMKKGEHTLRDFIRKSEDGNVFVFHGNRWFNETDPERRPHLWKYVSEDLYDDRHAALSTAVELDDTEQSRLILNLRNKTSDGQSIRNIITHALCDALPVPEGGFDDKPYLLGFENGVMELPMQRFRPYRFDDFMTLTTGYDYEEPNFDDPATAEMRETIIRIMSEIQEDQDRRVLLTQIMASALDGVNYQYLFMLNGSGGNGKGLLSRLMRKVLGKDLCYCPNGSILKDVCRANGCSPDIADLYKKRYVLFTEMAGVIQLNAVKRLTGGDSFTGRQPYGRNFQFALSATLAGEFNPPGPEFDSKPQDAEYRRFMDIHFKNNWTENPDKIGKTIDGITYRKANSYYASDEFVEKAKHVFLDMLLGCYQHSYRDGNFNFDIPTDIWRSSKKMLDDANKFKQIFETLYEPAPDREEDTEANRIKFGTVWSQISYSEDYRLGKHKAPREFERHWGQKNCFAG